jgi:antitoxin (DNA-binding transcriptional repressor) of toxin-antitoxin stability system
MSREETSRRRRSIADVKAHFAECVRDAEAGRTTIVTRHGRAVARLEPSHRPQHEVDPATTEEIAEPSSSYSASQARVPRSREARRAALHALLVEAIWPRVPKELLGKGLTKREREEILGYDEATGVSSHLENRDRR